MIALSQTHFTHQGGHVIINYSDTFLHFLGRIENLKDSQQPLPRANLPSVGVNLDGNEDIDENDEIEAQISGIPFIHYHPATAHTLNGAWSKQT